MTNDQNAPPPGEPPGGGNSSGQEDWGAAERSAAERSIVTPQKTREAAEIQELRSKIRLQWLIAGPVITLFLVLNIGVFVLIWNAYFNDLALIRQGIITWEGRLITENVVMSLIAGTVAEVATILLGITWYLFPRRAPSGAQQRKKRRRSARDG